MKDSSQLNAISESREVLLHFSGKRLLLGISILLVSACAPSSPISTFEVVSINQAAEDAESHARTTKHYLEKLKDNNLQLEELVERLKKEAEDAEGRATSCEQKLRVLGVEILSQPSPKLPDINK